MKTIILNLILFGFLHAGISQTTYIKTNSKLGSNALNSNKENKIDLSATDFIIDENDVMIRDKKTNSFPTDKNSPFYKINKRTEKPKEINIRPRTFTEIRKFDFYSKNRAD